MSFNNSVEEHSWSNEEWSVDLPSELFIQTLSFSLSSRVNIDHSPFLVDLTIVFINNYWMSFKVLASFNWKCLVVECVDELLSIILENLPPVGVGAPDLHGLVLARAMNVPWLVVKSGSNSEW
jgi:hypothetical protein